MVLKKDSLISSILLTSFSQIIVTLLNILILKFLAVLIVEESFGVYLTTRRFIGLMFAFLLLNMNMSITRFISFYESKAEEFFLFAMTIMSVLSSLFFFFALFFKEMIAQGLFNNSQYDNIIPAIFIFLFANCFHILSIGYFRGKQNFRTMNFMDVLFWLYGFLIIYVFVIFPGNFNQQIITYLLIYAFFSLCSNLYFLFKYGNFTQLPHTFLRILRLKQKIIPSEFTRYGFIRLPSSILIEALFLGPIVISTHLFGLRFAAYLGIIIAFVRMIQLIAYPIGIIFLPKFSSLQASGEKARVRNYSQLIIEFVVSLPLLVGALSILFSKELITIWFGKNYSPVIPYLNIISPFVGMVIVYVILRSLLDGSSNYPYVNIITSVAFIGMILLTFVLYQFVVNPAIIVFSFAMGITLLGVLAINFTIRLFHIRFFTRKVFFAMLWYLFVFIVSYYCSIWIDSAELLIRLMSKIVIALVLLSLSYGFYRLCQFEWINEFWQRVKSING